MAWNGLIRKEWMLMRWSAIVFVVTFTVIAISSFAPIAVGGIFDVNELVQMFSTMHMFFGAALFLHSLHTDMKQPDVWFHSPASIGKLLGVKAMMACPDNFRIFSHLEQYRGYCIFYRWFCRYHPRDNDIAKTA